MKNVSPVEHFSSPGPLGNNESRRPVGLVDDPPQTLPPDKAGDLGEVPAPTFLNADPIVVFARLLRMFDDAYSLSLVAGPCAFALTVYADAVECAEEATRIWASSRHLQIEESDTDHGRGITVRNEHGDSLFRIHLATHKVRAAIARAREIAARGRR